MKKAAKAEYGITITKPWSKEMYDHNDEVAEAVKVKVLEMWTNACSTDSVEFETELQLSLSDMDWEYAATPEMIRVQKAVTCYGFGSGYDVAEVARRVELEIEDAPYYRLKDIAEELDILLKKGFVGF